MTSRQTRIPVLDTAAYLTASVPTPELGSVGGDWAVIGLARSGCRVPDSYFSDYAKRVEQAVAACGGVLSERKYTDYSRVILALTAIGGDPSNVGGYNLLLPLGDYEKTVFQGLNGAIWALIALDSGNYEIPVNQDATIQATRQHYVEPFWMRSSATAAGRCPVVAKRIRI